MTAIDRGELMRLRGEQVTLQKELTIIQSQIKDERRLFQGFVNSLSDTHTLMQSDWVEVQTARLKRLEQLMRQEQDCEEKLKELRLVTGL